MIIAFQDPDTHTSELKIIKQGSGLNIHKLKCLAILHWEVMHDKISVTDASTEISRLMTAKPTVCRAPSFLPFTVRLIKVCSGTKPGQSFWAVSAPSALASQPSNVALSTCW